MILADTSVWIDHLRRSEPLLQSRLEAQEVLTHPFVLGELALASWKNRRAILTDLGRVSMVAHASPSEVLRLIEAQELAGCGVGDVDVHLLASARITPGRRLWTHDKRLAAVARRLGVGWTLH